MGVVLGMLGKNIIVPPGLMPGSNFSNAVGESALYRRAQGNLDSALAKKQQYENMLQAAKQKLYDLIAAYTLPNGSGNLAPLRDQILAGDYNVAIGKLVADEMYGNPSSTIWGKITGDLRNQISTKITAGDWYAPGSQNPGAIFGNGVAHDDPWNAAQRELVKHWLQHWYDPKVIQLANNVSVIEDKIKETDKSISKYTLQRDAALVKEKEASDQRIKENESDPAYIAALAEREKTKARNRNILILGGLGILVIGAAVVFRNR